MGFVFVREKTIIITISFQKKKVDESNHIPNKICDDKGNRILQ